MRAELAAALPQRAARRLMLVPKKEQRAEARVIQCFFNADLRNSHDGLAAIAKEAGIDVSKLVPGQFVVFINSDKNRIKLFAASHVVAYYKAPHGRVDLNSIREIPRVFLATGKVDFEAALKARLLESLARRGRTASITDSDTA